MAHNINNQDVCNNNFRGANKKQLLIIECIHQIVVNNYKLINVNSFNDFFIPKYDTPLKLFIAKNREILKKHEFMFIETYKKESRRQNIAFAALIVTSLVLYNVKVVVLNNIIDNTNALIFPIQYHILRINFIIS